MSLTLVVETGAGLTTANSYASVAEGDAYHDAHLYSDAWDDATDATKDIVLAWATRLLDEQVPWKGTKASIGQALQWPRYSVPDRDGITIIDADEIPAWLKNATAELARHLIGEDRTADSDTKGFKSIKVGEIALEIDREDRKPILPKAVISMVEPFSLGMGMGTVRLLRS